MSHLRSDDSPPAPRRLSWGRYLVIIGVVLLAAVGLAVPVIAGSDWHHTDYSSVAAHKPEPVALTATQVSRKWNQNGVGPVGNPVVADTVVTADEHGVTGRDPETGKSRWTYRRSNAELCRWAVQDTTVVTIFANGHRCSDLAAFDAATGRRLWYLNADLGDPVTLVPGPVVFLAYTGSQINAFYVNGGNQAWTFHKKGCTITDAASGDLGAFAITKCADTPDTAVSLDAYNGKERWRRVVPGTDPAIVSATGVVAFISHQEDADTVSFFSDDGSVTGQVRPPGTRTGSPIASAAAQVGPRVVTYVGGEVLVLDPVRAKVSWWAPAAGPALVAANTVVVPDPDRGFIEYRPDGQRGSTIAGQVPAGISALGRVRDEIVTVRPDGTTVYG